LQDNNLKFQQVQAAEMENILREAGINDEADAKAIGALVKKMAADDELDIQAKRVTANQQTFGVWNNTRMLLRDLGELLFHVKLN
jgi:hypothetical protein